MTEVDFISWPGDGDDDAGVAEGHDEDGEDPGEGEEVEEVCQLLKIPEKSVSSSKIFVDHPLIIKTWTLFHKFVISSYINYQIDK